MQKMLLGFCFKNIKFCITFEVGTTWIFLKLYCVAIFTPSLRRPWEKELSKHVQRTRPFFNEVESSWQTPPERGHFRMLEKLS